MSGIPFSVLSGFIPIIIISLLIGVLHYLVAGKKGENQLKWFGLGSIPFFNYFSIIYLMSFTNADIKKFISDFKKI